MEGKKSSFSILTSNQAALSGVDFVTSAAPFLVLPKSSGELLFEETMKCRR